MLQSFFNRPLNSLCTPTNSQSKINRISFHKLFNITLSFALKSPRWPGKEKKSLGNRSTLHAHWHDTDCDASTSKKLYKLHHQVHQQNFFSVYLQMTVMGANFVTSCEIQLLRKPGRRPLCQIHRYPRFRRRCGQHCAYRKLCLRNRRPTVEFSTSFVEKPGQRSRLTSRRCSISLTLSEEYVWTTSSKRSWRVVMHPSCSNAEITENARIRNSSFRGAIDNFFFFARRSDSSRVRGSTSVFSRAQRKLVRDR